MVTLLKRRKQQRMGKFLSQKLRCNLILPYELLPIISLAELPLSELESTKVSGICEGSDESMFESSLKEPES